MTERLTVKIGRGNIYVPLETYETYFKNLEAVALLPHEQGILMIPLIQQSAGGLILKVKNLRGDRVVHSQEFFRSNNIPESFEETKHDIVWENERHSLLIKL